MSEVRVNFDKILDYLIDRCEYASHLVNMDEISANHFQTIKRQTEQLQALAREELLRAYGFQVKVKVIEEFLEAM